MKVNKSTILFGASIACLGLFIISFIKLILGDSSDASQNSGFAYSIIAGIVIAILTIIEIIRQYKKSNGSGFISYIVSGFKKENGKDTFHLILALLFSCFPIVILIAVLVLCAGASAGSSVKNNSQTNSGGQSSKTSGNSSNKNSEDAEFKRKNHLAGNTNTDAKQITEGSYKEIQNIYKSNPGISDEDALAIYQKSHPTANIETVRAHRPLEELSYQEINSRAGHTSNKAKPISEPAHNAIQKIYRSNPGLTDEEAFEIFNKSNPGIANIETVRAHKPVLNLSNDELNDIARSSSNNIKSTPENVHNAIRKIYKDNPGISDEKAQALLSKSHSGYNVETVRAHKPQ